MDKESISFILPCYNSTNTLRAVVDEIEGMMEENLSDYEFEIICVNDCSPDKTTYSKIKEIASEDIHVKGLSLARNFGQPSAVMAGMHYATGDYIVCGDDDGQTPFNEFPKLFEKIREGYDIVEANYAIREKRSLFRKFGTFMNEEMANCLINKPSGLVLTTYWCIRRFIAQEMLKYENPYPYLGGLILRCSKNACNVMVTHRERLSGKSGYSIKKMLSLWTNGFTNFSVKPLRVATISGMVLCFISFCFTAFTIVQKFVGDVPSGYPTIICLMLFGFGINFVFLGLIGEYVGRIFISLNCAPQFLVKEKINISGGEKKDS